MFSVFINSWKNKDVRRKIVFTLVIIAIFRLGSNLFVPFLNQAGIQAMLGDGSSILNFLDSMTGGALGKGTIFAMSITPYINASIIIQLLTVALPPLERLQKEGTTGRKKIDAIKRVLALTIGLFQATAFYFGLKKQGAVLYTEGITGVIVMLAIILSFVAGAMVIMWLGDCISRNGVGNGISIILLVGIVSRAPHDIMTLINNTVGTGDPTKYPYVLLVGLSYTAMVVLVVLMNNSERRIPVQYAKRQVGRKMYGGQSSFIPIKVAMTGVMPIIFAMSLMSLPPTVLYFFGIDGQITAQGDNDELHPILSGAVHLFNAPANFNWQAVVYMVVYLLLIVGFNYFYVAMQYNPVEIANNLKRSNGSIPGYRPGKPTSDHIYHSLSRITLIGALMLGVIAIFPMAFAYATGLKGLNLGGTSLLIIVSVILELVRQLEGQMVMRRRKGFLD
ncbi:protein translocase subunit SecY [Clostridia bacterium]|nr:protein translocase subunit SecY [Clostridia bacterium]